MLNKGALRVRTFICTHAQLLASLYIMMNLRKHDRISVDYPSVFSGGARRGNGVILDLSSDGCRVSSASLVRQGDLLGVLIEVPGYEHSLYITRTIVRWANDHEFGVEFLLMDLPDRQRLDHMVQKAGTAESAQRLAAIKN